jgi:hypothetical protein
MVLRAAWGVCARDGRIEGYTVISVVELLLLDYLVAQMLDGGAHGDIRQIKEMSGLSA